MQLNYFNFASFNGVSKGINNALKVFINRAYGFKDFEYLQIKASPKKWDTSILENRF
ncbi:MAG: transposase [Candidatus Cloacimonetes bacterium]|nr:transposase [Candidatus Cloacimonadota bacterium]